MQTNARAATYETADKLILVEVLAHLSSIGLMQHLGGYCCQHLRRANVQLRTDRLIFRGCSKVVFGGLGGGAKLFVFGKACLERIVS